MGKCVFCKGDMVDDITNYVVNDSNGYVAVENVPCKKCTQCGEIEFDGDVVAKLENISDNGRAIKKEISVYSYVA